ncbi:MAG: fasciclin domain-containing protein [Actinobacteria bacterium]|nr:fasciclin domain-containing protein [Actinomycetota bacterium]
MNDNPSSIVRSAMKLLGSLVCLALLAACGSAATSAASSPSPQEQLRTVSPERASDMTIAEVLGADERFTIFHELADSTETGIPGHPSWLEVWDWDAERLGNDRDGVTVFVPTDDAFAATASELVPALRDGDLVNQARYIWLGHHYVHLLYPSSDFEAGRQHTWRGNVDMTLDPLAWGGHAVVQTDLRTANGYIHVIDGVVVPAEVRDAAKR